MIFSETRGFRVFTDLAYFLSALRGMRGFSIGLASSDFLQWSSSVKSVNQSGIQVTSNKVLLFYETDHASFDASVISTPETFSPYNRHRLIKVMLSRIEVMLTHREGYMRKHFILLEF